MTTTYIRNFKRELSNAENNNVSKDTQNYIDFVNHHPGNKFRLKKFIDRNNHQIFENVTEIINVTIREKNSYFPKQNQQTKMEMFTEFVDGIYFEGYAQQMANTNPDKFDWEFKEFEAQN